MRILFVLVLSLLSCTVRAQLITDSAIIKKYKADSLGFRSFPEGFLLDHIQPVKGIMRWELNTISFAQDMRSETPGKPVPVAKNLYRYSVSAKKTADSIVLAKAVSGFGTTCPPSWCGWYIAAKKNGKTILAVNRQQLGAFLGTISNQYDALLWVLAQDLADSRGVPLNTTPAISYRQVKKGYLVKLNIRISDCHITYADVTYFVGCNKKVVLIRSVITSISQSCI